MEVRRPGWRRGATRLGRLGDVVRLVGGCWLELLAPVLPADDGELVAGLEAVAAEFEAAEEGGGLKLSCRREGIFGGEVVAVVGDQGGGVGLCR